MTCDAVRSGQRDESRPVIDAIQSEDIVDGGRMDDGRWMTDERDES